MAAVSKGFGVGDTVYVYYRNHATLRFTPQSRVVSSVDVLDGSNTAVVKFTNGEQVNDGASTLQQVYTTEALCANRIIDDVISEFDACAVLNSTTSGVSTAGQPTLGLVRSSA